MNTQELHDGFQTELIRRGLPVEYASGAAAELADHHRDVVEELRATALDDSAAETEAANRLGDRRQLVKKSVREFQRRHWCGRWPLVTFLFGPIVLLAGTWVASGLLLACLALLAGDSGPGTVTPGIGPMADYMIMRLFSSWFVLLLPAAVIIFLARRGSRAALDSRWIVLAASVLALTVGTMKCGPVGQHLSGIFTNSETGEPLDPGMFVVSLPYIPFLQTSSEVLHMYTSDPWQLVQLLLPLSVAGLMIWRSIRLKRQWEQSFPVGC